MSPIFVLMAIFTFTDVTMQALLQVWGNFCSENQVLGTRYQHHIRLSMASQPQ